MKKINLLPFDSQSNEIKVKAALKNSLTQIHCTWELTGIALNSKNNIGTQKEELWKTNVFEFFLKKKSEEKYYEIHLDEFLNWNIYQSSHYRSELLKTNDILIEQANINSNEKRSIISLSLKLTKNILSKKEWLFLCPVIWKVKNTFQYFSPRHPEEKPDFHLSEYYNEL